MTSQTKVLRESLGIFREDADRSLATQEGRDFAAMIAGTINRLVKAIDEGRTADARLETLTFSRQVSDTYLEIPPALAQVSQAVEAIRKTLKTGIKG